MNLSKLRTDSTVIITPSGGRPRSLSFLNGYLERQTDQDFFWIVSDDCVPRSPKPERCDYFYHPPWEWKAGMMTQRENMELLLNFCLPSQKVMVCEDDDWYHPDYVSETKKNLESADLVGFHNPIYYSVPTRTYRSVRRRAHATLSATGFKGDALDRMKAICARHFSYIDVRLWKWRGSKYIFPSPVLLCVGMKGSEGRRGVTDHGKIGHADSDMEFLKSIIGEDVKNYKK